VKVKRALFVLILILLLLFFITAIGSDHFIRFIQQFK